MTAVIAVVCFGVIVFACLFVAVGSLLLLVDYFFACGLFFTPFVLAGVCCLANTLLTHAAFTCPVAMQIAAKAHVQMGTM